jgi:branched-chain amino acid transport system permease protein
VTDIRLVSFALCAALAAGVVVYMKKSRMGRAIRATAQDPRAARVLGVDTERVYAFTFSLNAAICGAAGALISMIWVLQPYYGIAYSVRAFVIVTAAGLGNLPGVIVAALGLGALEQYSGFVLGAQFQQATIVGLLLLILIVKQMMLLRHRQALQ